MERRIYEDADAFLAHLDRLDLRTTEEIADDEAAAPDANRETLTGLPARPGTIR